jgi:hypothetical protein
LAWLGLPRLMRPKPDRAVSYVMIAVACAIVITAAVTLIEGALIV